MRKEIAMKHMIRTALVATALVASGSAIAKTNPRVGGAAMYPTKTIVENAVNSKDHTTLVAAVKAAGLVETLSGPGPFTVFAPTNAAFAKLPAGTVDTLVKPENKAQLTSILTYHVVPGTISAADIAAKAKASGGTATYTTSRAARSASPSPATAGRSWTARATRGGSRSPTSISRTA
jgi:uncharacterized surface protein with fasciclin (FAS1) repeats